MELKRRNLLVYGVLAACWALVAAWQWADHVRVKELAREELIHRARDVSSTAAITIRAFRRFGGVVSKERLEEALKDLLRPDEWEGIALLNEAGTVVASAGELTGLDPKGPPEVWGTDNVVLMNLVALGTNITRDLEGTNTVIVDFRNQTNRPPAMGPGDRDRDRGDRDRDRAGADSQSSTNSGATANVNRNRPGQNRPRFSRPPGWTEAEWKAMLERQGVHSFAILMSTHSFQETTKRDLRLRSIIMLLAAVSVAGLGLAWQSFSKSSFLQLRLVRTSELNTHLKEMNLAAAGLAHETRNPLNIIRGMAQLISKQPNTAAEVREKSRAIVDETDKVTAQLNEFINYSRPREVRHSTLGLHSLAHEVVRALSYDIEEKKIRIEVKGERFSIQADEQLLRQVLFNLVLNATQAVGENGAIEIVAQRQSASEASLEVRDNGPGVPPERRSEIFKPYFTTNAKGTGLGLAIVQQNVLAHGWDVEVLANQPKGAIFRIKHLKLAKG